MEEALIYALLQALMAAKSMYFERLRQQGKTDAEIEALWKAKWDEWKKKQPDLDLPIV